MHIYHSLQCHFLQKTGVYSVLDLLGLYQSNNWIADGLQKLFIYICKLYDICTMETEFCKSMHNMYKLGWVWVCVPPALAVRREQGVSHQL